MMTSMLVEIDANIAALRALLASQLADERRMRGSPGLLLAIAIF